MLRRHPSLVIAQNSVTKARFNLRLAEITPWVPNLDANGWLQRPYHVPAEQRDGQRAGLGATIPLWDRNQGNIFAAQGDPAHARQEYERARNDLMTSLADAFCAIEPTARWSITTAAQFSARRFGRTAACTSVISRSPTRLPSATWSPRETLAQAISTDVQTPATSGKQWWTWPVCSRRMTCSRSAKRPERPDLPADSIPHFGHPAGRGCFSPANL